VFRNHHEGLEHLLHLAYYTMGLKPPRLLRRVASSSAHAVGRSSGWRAALLAADELPMSLQSMPSGVSSPLLDREESRAASSAKLQQQLQQQQQKSGRGGAGASAAAAAAGTAGGGVGSGDALAVQRSFAPKVERSWHRVSAAFDAGAKAQLGAKAEVVVMAAHHKR
jgi:hypothetical protein